MRVSFDDPPHNIRKLCEEQFGLDAVTPVWTFGEVIHNPHRAELTADLVAHEEVHSKQQGDNPIKWWLHYSERPQFRFEQEAEAYRAQYKYAKKRIKDRNQLAKYLHLLANDLSGPMYGNLCTHLEAMAKIKV